MDDMTRFERQFEDRVRAFAGTGVRAVDSAAVARAVAVESPRGARGWFAVRWLGLPFDRRALALALALGLLVLLMTLSAFVGGGRPSAIESNPAISPSQGDPTFDPHGPIPAAIGGLITPREGEVAVALADGRVLILGGRGVTEGQRAMLASAEIYDPATRSFVATGSMTEPRYQPLVARLHDGRVLVVGSSEDADLASAEVYDPPTGTFKAVGSMPFARGGCHCGINFLSEVRPTMTVLADGRVMIVGGREGTTPAGHADIFDPGTGRFTPSALIPCDASRGTVTGLLDGTALVTCRAGDGLGSTLADWQARAYIYDAGSDTFAPTGAPTTDDSGTTTLLSDGRVLLTGPGLRDSAAPAELYDPASGTFAPVDDGPDLYGHDLNASPNAASLALDNGFVLFVRRDEGHSLVFDPLRQHFTPYMLPWPMQSGAAAGLGGGRVLLLPGTSDVNPPPAPTVIDLSGFQPADTSWPTPSAVP